MISDTVHKYIHVGTYISGTMLLEAARIQTTCLYTVGLHSVTSTSSGFNTVQGVHSLVMTSYFCFFKISNGPRIRNRVG